MLSLVPMVKRDLEKFVFEVKQMLNANNNLQAFWIGRLKHRNIKVVPSCILR